MKDEDALLGCDEWGLKPDLKLRPVFDWQQIKLTFLKLPNANGARYLDSN
jgi:hypothetical protein